MMDKTGFKVQVMRLHPFAKLLLLPLSGCSSVGPHGWERLGR